MKKKRLEILSLTALFALAGCTSTAKATRAANEEAVFTYAPTYVKANETTIALSVGDTRQVGAVVRPLRAYDTDLSYEVVDTNIATVDEEGVVTAVSAGKTTMKVYATDYEDVFDTITIYVTTPSTDSTVISSQKALQDSLSEPAAVETMMDYNYVIYENNRAKESYIMTRHMINSKRDGFFYMSNVGYGTNCVNGGISYTDSSYSVWTNESFDTFVFHEMEGVKNVFYAPTNGYLDKGVSQYDVVDMVLNTLFTKGKKNLSRNNLERALEHDDLQVHNDQTNDGISIWGTASGNVLYGRNNRLVDYSTSVRGDQESSYGIPANTSIVINDTYDYIWENGYCRMFKIVETIVYQLNGKTYTEAVTIVYSLKINDEVVCDLPNVQDYHIVPYLYDL